MALKRVRAESAVAPPETPVCADKEGKTMPRRALSRAPGNKAA